MLSFFWPATCRFGRARAPCWHSLARFLYRCRRQPTTLVSSVMLVNRNTPAGNGRRYSSFLVASLIEPTHYPKHSQTHNAIESFVTSHGVASGSTPRLVGMRAAYFQAGRLNAAVGYREPPRPSPTEGTQTTFAPLFPVPLTGERATQHLLPLLLLLPPVRACFCLCLHLAARDQALRERIQRDAITIDIQWQARRLLA